jgi:hypothetical protein
MRFLSGLMRLLLRVKAGSGVRPDESSVGDRGMLSVFTLEFEIVSAYEETDFPRVCPEMEDVSYTAPASMSEGRARRDAGGFR